MINKPLQTFSVFVALFLALMAAPAVWAHGTEINVTVDGTQVQVASKFETGEPMADAQIIIYAPDNPREAWGTGDADSDGNFTFDIDNTLAGEWAISIRISGHGEIRHVMVGQDGSISPIIVKERSGWQTALLATGVVLGFGGVAFYFSKTRNAQGS